MSTGLCAGETLCQVCGFEYVHIKGVKVAKGPNGTIILIDFWCENGHDFEASMTEHKGQVLAEMWQVRKVKLPLAGD